MSLESYYLDRVAHDLVLDFRNCDKEVRNQVYKMRVNVAYGLERFWGEQFRLDGDKARYWAETWDKLVKIMRKAGIKIPNDEIPSDDINSEEATAAIKQMAGKLWDFPIDQRKVALVVLAQLCECMVWWTQRYKPSRGGENSGGEGDE